MTAVCNFVMMFLYLVFLRLCIVWGIICEILVLMGALILITLPMGLLRTIYKPFSDLADYYGSKGRCRVINHDGSSERIITRRAPGDG